MFPAVHPSLLLRKIIHFDMDAYYASIEIRDNPSLKDKPVVIGGNADSRGVVCTASYEARKFGIRSAMASAHAAKLCPHAIFIRPNFEKYLAVTRQIQEIFKKYTPLVEPISLDEAYLDVTHNEQGLYATKIARLIQNEIFEKTQLTGSAGIAPNKMLAKIASDMNKPNGLTVILPEQVHAFMETLPLRKINGIGPVTEKSLAAKGFTLCRDLWPYSLAELEEKIGNHRSVWLYERARGVDDRQVEIDRIRKSLGSEDTFATDILDMGLLKNELEKICYDVMESLNRKQIKGKTVTLKVKYHDFTRITRAQTLEEAVESAENLIQITKGMLESKTEAGKKRIRLLGVSVSNFCH
jgi:DNA polymerase-4